MELWREMASALLLGLLTTVQPCPFTTNATAVSVLLGLAPCRSRAWLLGIAFLLGLVLTFALLGVAVTFGGISIPALASHLQFYAARLQGPVLILVGMLVSGLLLGPGPLLRWSMLQERIRDQDAGLWMALVAGSALALSFCPTTAAIFFGLLVPLALRSRAEVLLPVIYGLGAGIPVLCIVIAALKGVQLATGKGWRVKILVGGVLILFGLFQTLRSTLGWI